MSRATEGGWFPARASYTMSRGRSLGVFTMPRTCAVAAALLVPSLAPALAFAQDPDAQRYRTGIGLNVGGMVVGGGVARKAATASSNRLHSRST